MQALHQGAYGYYVYVFSGNVMEKYIRRSVLRFLKFSLLHTRIYIYIYVASMYSYIRMFKYSYLATYVRMQLAS